MIQQCLKELNLQLGIHWLEGDILKINTLNMLFYAVWNIRWRRLASTSAMSTSDNKSNLDWLQNLTMSPLELPLLQLKLYMHRTLEETDAAVALVELAVGAVEHMDEMEEITATQALSEGQSSLSELPTTPASIQEPAPEVAAEPQEYEKAPTPEMMEIDMLRCHLLKRLHERELIPLFSLCRISSATVMERE
jgi:hypothetical protein